MAFWLSVLCLPLCIPLFSDARYDTETTIQMVDSSFEGYLDDSGSDDSSMADHDQAGLEADDDAGSKTVMSSSEHGKGSDGENDSDSGNSEGNKDTAENVDPEENEGDTEESCGSENELEQGAMTPKTRNPQAWKRIKRSRLRNSGSRTSKQQE